MVERPFGVVHPLLRRVTSRLSFQGKIRLLPKVAGAALVLILLMSVTLGLVIQRSANRIREGYYPSVQLSQELREGLSRIQRRLQDGVSAQEVGPLDEAQAIADTLLRSLDRANGNPVLDRDELRALREEIGSYHTLARRTSERMIQGELGDSVFNALKTMTERYNALSQRLENNIARDEAEIAAAFRAADALRLANTGGVALVAVLCVALLWALSSFTARLLTTSLTDPLSHAVEVADRLAMGDMTVTIHASVDGEMGRLLRSMEQMLQYLGEMANAAGSIADGDLATQIHPRSSADSFGNAFESMTRYLNEMAKVAESVSAGDMTQRIEPRSAKDSFGRAFQTMARSLTETMEEMRAAAEAISGAATQLAASAQDLSQSTNAETAIVMAATKGVERVNGLVERNAADTITMEQMALQGAKDAEESGLATRETLTAMGTISEKISIVDRIATQTNLLAINAAIEAARAGEQGRGFGVVADEVGKLATGSRDAAREIVSVVRTSHEVAERCGDLLSKLVPAIGETAALVQQVAATSAEQAKGLKLVDRAMGEVDQATQRNAAAAQQLAATASEMALQAESLQRALSRFRLSRFDSAGDVARERHPSESLAQQLPTALARPRLVAAG